MPETEGTREAVVPGSLERAVSLAVVCAALVLLAPVPTRAEPRPAPDPPVVLSAGDALGAALFQRRSPGPGTREVPGRRLPAGKAQPRSAPRPDAEAWLESWQPPASPAAPAR